MDNNQTQAQEKIGYLKAQLDLSILMTAMQGNKTREALAMPNTSPQDLLGRGFDDDELSVAVEASFELERLIREGKSLSHALAYMREQGWLKRINEEGI